MRFRASELLARLNRRTSQRPQLAKPDPRQPAFPIEDPQEERADMEAAIAPLRLAGRRKTGSKRQLLPRAEPIKTAPMAAEIAEAIRVGQAADRLKWGHDGTVRVVLTKVFPYGSGYMRPLPDGASGSARHSPSFWQRAAGAKSGATFTPEKLRPGSEAKSVLSEGRVGWSCAGQAALIGE